MKNARYLLGVGLLVGVTAAVSAAVTQAPPAQPEPRSESRSFMVLAGRGAHLGVTVSELSADELQQPAGVTSGVRISEVDRDSPASRAGLREGDIVVEYDGERVRSTRQFSRLVQETADGRTVSMVVVRDGERQTLQATPENRATSLDLDARRMGRDLARLLRDREPELRSIEPRLRELEPRLRELEPRLRELEPRLREFGFDGPMLNFDWRGGVSPRARLGVQVETLTPQLAEYFGVPEGGVLIAGVSPASAAEKAGLRAGDVITSINDTAIRDSGALVSHLRDATGEVTLGIVRDRQEATITATLEEEARPRSRRPVV